MWFLIWTLLALGTLVGAFFLFRSLWRQFRALLREGGDSAERVGEIGATLQGRIDARIAQQPSTAATVGRDPELLRPRVAESRRVRAEHKEHRRRPRPDIYARWLSIYR